MNRIVGGTFLKKSSPHAPFKKPSLKSFLMFDQIFLSALRSLVRSADFFVYAPFYGHYRTAARDH